MNKIKAILAFLFLPISIFAYNFELDGIYYNILSEEDRTVETTYLLDFKGNVRTYEGEIEIPKKLIYNSKTYTVTAIGDKTFYYCSKLNSVSIPNSVTSIGEFAFYMCGDLTSVTISNSVTSIGYAAFSSCSGLTSVSIPNSVTSIGKHAFSGCSGLTSVSIPNSVTSIGDYAFDGCTNLQYIYCMPTTPPNSGSFSDENYKNTTLYVPVGSLSAYEKVDPWRNFWNIEEYDFSGVDDITIEDYSECPVEIYNLSGNKVGSSKESLSPGIYIMRQGRKVEKIMIQ